MSHPALWSSFSHRGAPRQLWKPVELMLVFPGVSRLAAVMKTQFTLSELRLTFLTMEEKNKGNPLSLEVGWAEGREQNIHPPGVSASPEITCFPLEIGISSGLEKAAVSPGQGCQHGQPQKLGSGSCPVLALQVEAGRAA